MELDKMNKAQLTERIGELEAQLAAAKEANGSADVDALKADLDAERDKTTKLEDELKSAQALADQVPELQQMVKDLNGRSIAQHASADPSKPIFKCDGKHYQVIAGVNLKGTNYSPADIAKNPAVQKQLVAMKSGTIKQTKA